jgi:hypothetical protein
MDAPRICSNCGFDAKDPAPVCPVCGSDFVAHGLTSHPALDWSAWLDALREDVAAQVTIKERVMKDTRTSYNESQLLQGQLVILRWIDQRLGSASNGRAERRKTGDYEK